MISEAIILAGGLGTRLRSVVSDVPKCMATVAGVPFLEHVIRHYHQQGITRFIFSLGYKHHIIEQFLEENHPELNYSCSIEEEPLGTGGAILQSAGLALQNDVLVLNGDTLFAIDLNQLATVHQQKESTCTLSLKPMVDSDRYGVVDTDANSRITSFLEKKWYAESNINGGVYALNLSNFTALPFPRVFSFEKEYLEQYYKQHRMYGVVQDRYFIDIGIPADYERAQEELKLH